MKLHGYGYHQTSCAERGHAKLERLTGFECTILGHTVTRCALVNFNAQMPTPDLSLLVVRKRNAFLLLLTYLRLHDQVEDKSYVEKEAVGLNY